MIFLGATVVSSPISSKLARANLFRCVKQARSHKGQPQSIPSHCSTFPGSAFASLDRNGNKSINVKWSSGGRINDVSQWAETETYEPQICVLLWTLVVQLHMIL
jgi:hypothetical protein